MSLRHLEAVGIQRFQLRYKFRLCLDAVVEVSHSFQRCQVPLHFIRLSSPAIQCREPVQRQRAVVSLPHLRKRGVARSGNEGMSVDKVESGARLRY